MNLENKSKEENPLRDFKEQIELIKKFPIKSFVEVKTSLPYDIEKPIEYYSYSSM
jgi:RNase P/RNase MRP subunit p30